MTELEQLAGELRVAKTTWDRLEAELREAERHVVATRLACADAADTYFNLKDRLVTAAEAQPMNSGWLGEH